MKTIRIAKTATDGLSQNVWEFWITDRLELILEGYLEQSRKTKRHKHKTNLCYGWVDWRRGNSLTEDEVNKRTPDEVWDEALVKAQGMITVLKENPYG